MQLVKTLPMQLVKMSLDSKQMIACEPIRVHAVVVDCFSDPGLHRLVLYGS